MSFRILFLHGFMGNSHEGDFLKEGLSNIDIELYAPPLIGITNQEALEKLYLEIDRFNPHLIYGYSMGGRLTLDLCAKLPLPALEYIVLESSALNNLTPQAAKKRRDQDEQRAKEILSDFTSFIEDWYQLPLWGKLEPDQKKRWQQIRLKENVAFAKNLAQQISYLSPGNFLLPKQENWPRSPEYLYLCGEQDHKYSTMIREFQASVSHFRVETSPRCGHNLHLQAPEFIIENLQKLLAP